jgi:hypothetical protein
LAQAYGYISAPIDLIEPRFYTCQLTDTGWSEDLASLPSYTASEVLRVRAITREATLPQRVEAFASRMFYVVPKRKSLRLVHTGCFTLSQNGRLLGSLTPDTFLGECPAPQSGQ